MCSEDAQTVASPQMEAQVVVINGQSSLLPCWLLPAMAALGSDGSIAVHFQFALTRMGNLEVQVLKCSISGK